MKKIQKLVKQQDTRVCVYRDQEWIIIMSSHLVPGDIFEVPYNCEMPCDCILLFGDLIVNESALTGEPNAAVKTAISKSETHIYSSI